MLTIYQQSDIRKIRQNPRYPRTVFIGTPDFAVVVLQSLLDNNYPIIAAITAPDKPVGRKQILTPPPVKELALKYNIPVFQPEKIRAKEWIEKIKKLNPDLIIVAAYGQIIPKEILDIPKYGGLNLHASLLPKYRGASPIQYAILNGEKETGVTLMLMDEKMDHGPIVANRRLQIASNDTAETLHNKLADLGAKLLIKTLPKWLGGKIKPKKQDHSRATFTKIITREDGRIDWKKSAEETERMARAFYPWPGAFTQIRIRNHELRIKVLETEVYKTNKNQKIKPGQIFLTPDKQLAIKCGKDALIIKKLRPEGKNPMTGEEFLRGYHKAIGEVLK